MRGQLFRGEIMNENLPIFAHKAEIMQAVKDHPVVIITAENGAGKSTQVPPVPLGGRVHYGGNRAAAPGRAHGVGTGGSLSRPLA